MGVLTFIVFACHMNVTPIPPSIIDFDAPPPSGCRVFEEEVMPIGDEPHLTPMGCIMQSPMMVAKFQENHPGMEPRKWVCKYVRPYAKI